MAKDLDVLRAVLGDSKLTYVGWSYGTSIGTQYAEQFPANVRAMILDGAVDPTRTRRSSNGRPDRVVPEGLRRVRHGLREARSDCALGTDASKATATFQQLTRPLMDKPLDLADGRKLSFFDAVTGVSEAMYSDSLWTDLRKALSDSPRARATT